MDYVSKVKEIDEHADGLDKWEINFIANLIDNNVTEFSLKQKSIIDRLYEDLQ